VAWRLFKKFQKFEKFEMQGRYFLYVK